MGALRHMKSLRKLGDAVRPIVACANSYEQTGSNQRLAELLVAFRQGKPLCESVIRELGSARSFGGTYGAAEGRVLEGAQLVLNACNAGESAYDVSGDRITAVDISLAVQAAKASSSAYQLALV